MTVVMVPGPAMTGMPSGTIDGSNALAHGSLLLAVLERSPGGRRKDDAPAAIWKAGTVMPKIAPGKAN